MQFAIEKNRIIRLDQELLTTDNINSVECSFSFSPEYAGLDLFAVFYRGAELNRLVPIEAGKCILPWEMIKTEGVLYVGAYGIRNTTQAVEKQMTANSVAVTVVKSLTSDTVANAAPSPELWDRYRAEILGYRDETIGYRNEAEYFANEAEWSSIVCTRCSNQAESGADAANQAASQAAAYRDEAQAIKDSTRLQYDIKADRIGLKAADESNYTYTGSLVGPIGPPGKDGAGLRILDSYDSAEALYQAHPRGKAGDAYLVDGSLYVWSDSLGGWQSTGALEGPAGKDGLSAYEIAVKNGYCGMDTVIVDNIYTTNTALTVTDREQIPSDGVMLQDYNNAHAATDMLVTSDIGMIHYSLTECGSDGTRALTLTAAGEGYAHLKIPNNNLNPNGMRYLVMDLTTHADGTKLILHPHMPGNDVGDAFTAGIVTCQAADGSVEQLHPDGREITLKKGSYRYQFDLSLLSGKLDLTAIWALCVTLITTPTEQNWINAFYVWNTFIGSNALDNLGDAPREAGQYIVTSAGTATYLTATVPSVTALTPGANFILIPHVDLVLGVCFLNVNGLGDVYLYGVTSEGAPTGGNLAAGNPVRVIYNGTAWIADHVLATTFSRLMPSSILPVSNGGTGSMTPAIARVNLGISPSSISSSVGYSGAPSVVTYLSTLSFYTGNTMSTADFLRAIPEFSKTQVIVNPDYYLSDLPNAGSIYGLLEVMRGSANYKMAWLHDTSGNLYHFTASPNTGLGSWKTVALT